MLNTIKRDERRAEKALFKRMLNEHEMIEDMKEEITRLKGELNECKLDQEEVEKNKNILEACMTNRLLIALGI